MGCQVQLHSEVFATKQNVFQGRLALRLPLVVSGYILECGAVLTFLNTLALQARRRLN